MLRKGFDFVADRRRLTPEPEVVFLTKMTMTMMTMKIMMMMMRMKMMDLKRVVKGLASFVGRNAKRWKWRVSVGLLEMAWLSPTWSKSA